jgi:hypothetical protein
MSKIKYVYNPATLQFEEFKQTRKAKIQLLLGYTLAIIFTSITIYLVADKYVPSPKVSMLEKEIQQMEYYYTELNEEYNTLAEDVENLHSKDSEVHRMIFGIDPMDQAIWNGGVGGVDRYKKINDNFQSGELVEESMSKLDKLKLKVNLQNKSLEELYNMAIEKEKMLASIPSIKPVREDKLKRKVRNLSGYGIRLHPVHKVKKLHQGIDFTAPRGTPIQATGNGVVTRVESRKNGYGKNVIIDHGYGYTSLYAHMKKVEVKRGDKVIKGQKIGEVGSTGTSTAPHCHYEIRINGKAVNPIDYCLDGLSPEEYKELVENASVENQSFD